MVNSWCAVFAIDSRPWEVTGFSLEGVLQANFCLGSDHPCRFKRHQQLFVQVQLRAQSMTENAGFGSLAINGGMQLSAKIPTLTQVFHLSFSVVCCRLSSVSPLSDKGRCTKGHWIHCFSPAYCKIRRQLIYEFLRWRARQERHTGQAPSLGE